MEQVKESVKLVRKANDLVEARYKFNIWEMRIFTKMLTMIRRDDEDFKEYRIYLKDVINDFNLQKDNASYEWLKDGASRLLKKIITVVRQTDEGEKEFQTPIIAGVDSFADKRKAKYIDISFHPKMKPYLLQLKSQFLMYDVRNILLLQSMYSIRLYELLKQYETIGWRRIQVQELKEMMGIEDKYKLYGHFKSRVIIKAQKDLLKYCDIRFEFEEEKKGRKVESIVFHIFGNSPADRKNTKEQKIAAKSEKRDTLDKITKAWGITPATLRAWKSEYGADRLERSVEFTQQQLKEREIDNPGGYLRTILRDGIVEYSGKQAKIEKAERKKREKEEKKKALDLEIRLSDLKKEKNRKEYDIMLKLFVEVEGLREAVIAAAKQKRFSGFDSSLTEEENFANNPIFKAAVLNTMKKRLPDEFIKTENAYQTSLKRIQRDPRSFI